MNAVGGDAGELERGHLVLHQGHQGRDHDGEPAPQQGRNLEAKRFARARGHDGERVPAGQQGLDHGFLAGSEFTEAEGFPQRLPRIV